MTDTNGFANRIVGYGTKPADQFLHNPRNPRTHPQRQRDVVNASLRQLGFVAPVIENGRTGYLLDGHERVWQALQNNSEVPYVQVDIDESEEPLFLSTFDYMTGLAQYDAQLLDSLLADVQTTDEHLMAMLSEMAEDAGIIPPDFMPVGMDEQPRLDQKAPFYCPHCGKNIHDEPEA